MKDIDALTIKEVKQIQSLLKEGSGDEEAHPYRVGQNYLIRTVTHYYTGKLMRVTAKELVLSTAAWIADTGRFSDALRTGNLSEVEPIAGDVVVGRGAVVDAIGWVHALPTEQK